MCLKGIRLHAAGASHGQHGDVRAPLKSQARDCPRVASWRRAHDGLRHRCAPRLSLRPARRVSLRRRWALCLTQSSGARDRWRFRRPCWSWCHPQLLSTAPAAHVRVSVLGPNAIVSLPSSSSCSAISLLWATVAKNAFAFLMALAMVVTSFDSARRIAARRIRKPRLSTKNGLPGAVCGLAQFGTPLDT